MADLPASARLAKLQIPRSKLQCSMGRCGLDFGTLEAGIFAGSLSILRSRAAANFARARFELMRLARFAE